MGLQSSIGLQRQVADTMAIPNDGRPDFAINP
jgi:hypothetical protein